MANNERILRRPKRDPDRDAMHVLRMGFLVFIVLSFVLPALL